jgi:hypothetical protein
VITAFRRAFLVKSVTAAGELVRSPHLAVPGRHAAGLRSLTCDPSLWRDKGRRPLRSRLSMMGVRLSLQRED